VTTWQELADSAASCTRCDLYQRATATVFGAGRTAAGTMVLVGEEPGDQEDKQGRAFVGPTGLAGPGGVFAAIIGLPRSPALGSSRGNVVGC
jgi:uracil-DNA glycosylase family 4